MMDSLIYAIIYTELTVTKRQVMNKQIFKGKWNEVKGKLKQKWGKLTDDDLAIIEGKQEEIYGLLQKHYGYAKEEVDKHLDSDFK